MRFFSLDSASQQQATFATNIEEGEHAPVRADMTGRLLPAAKVSQYAAAIVLVLHWMKAFVLHCISNAGSLELLLKLIPWSIDTPFLGLRQYLTQCNKVPI